MKWLSCFYLTLGLSVALPAFAGGSSPYSIQAKAGTLGVGVDVIKNLYGVVDLRAGVNTLNISKNKRFGDTLYAADLDLQTFSLLADWHPKQSAMYLSGGVMINGNEISAKATPTGVTNIGGVNVTGANLDTKISFETIAPYIGVGYRKQATRSGWSFTAEIGVLYQQKPNVTLSVNDPGGALTLADVERERQEILKDADDLKFWPVINAGVVYNF